MLPADNSANLGAPSCAQQWQPKKFIKTGDSSSDAWRIVAFDKTATRSSKKRMEEKEKAEFESLCDYEGNDGYLVGL